MKAIIFERYGATNVLRYADIEKPRPRENEVLIKVTASGLNPIDWKIRRGMLKPATGKTFPQQLGFDVAGIIEETRSDRFRVGDEVYGCVGTMAGKTHAESVTLSESNIALKPANLNLIEAGAVPLAGLTALQVLRDFGRIRSGDRVLINGASGGVGSFAVQIARIFGASVDGVCSGRNLEYVRSLGVERAIDYTREDWTRGGREYDIIFDAVGKSSFIACRGRLTDRGIYITTRPSPSVLGWQLLTAWLPRKARAIFFPKVNTEDLEFLKKAIESGDIIVRIDRVYRLSETASAHAYSESERAVGKIVLVPDPTESGGL
jgi:NADPH:quinone reductase-like Zn-dependent oxidoreductase